MSYSIDYRNFSPNDTTKNVSKKWWELEGNDVADSIANILVTLKDNQNKLEAQRHASAKLYGNIPLYGTLGITSGKGTATMPVVRDRLTYNVVQSCVDTVTAKIAKNKPKPLFLTNGGNYKLQRKAKKLNQFVDGIFFDNQVHRVLSPLIFRDSAVLGDGIVHAYDWFGQVKFERVLASEILVDEIEAIYGYPRQLHRCKNIDRDQLIQMFPKHEAKIKVAQASMVENNTIPHVSDQITVCESWHLRSSPDATDGRRVMVMTGCKLTDDKDEEWDEDYFPFAKLPWCPRLYGFWAQGGVEQIQNIQLEINKLLWVIQRSMHLMGSFKIAVKTGSKVVPAHLNNDIAAIWNYTGDVPPQYMIPPIVQPEIYAHLATLKAAAYEQFGISQLSASSKKPDGLDSGKALREFNDIESERFMITGQNYESYHLDLSKLGVCTARRIAKYNNGSVKSRVPGSKFLETIDWKEIDLQEDQYVMQTFPISSLPSDPAGRLATIQEYAQAGYLDPRTARKLADFPDLQQVETLANAVEERILDYLDAIVDEGKYTPPDPFMDLALAKQLALQYYNQFVTQELEEDKLEMLIQFMNQIDGLMQAAQPPAPPMDQAAPQAVAAPPPVSEMIPNVPQQPMQ